MDQFQLDLPTFWFLVLAFFWVGYFVLEGFDFGVGMLLGVLGARQHGPARPHQHDRPALGRQRGLARRRRRRDVRRVPALVRDALQLLLPAAAAHRHRARRARGRLRVPRQALQRPVDRQLGPGDHGLQPAARPPVGRRALRPAQRHPDRRRPAVRRQPARPRAAVHAARRAHDALAVPAQRLGLPRHEDRGRAARAGPRALGAHRARRRRCSSRRSPPGRRGASRARSSPTCSCSSR